MKVSAIKQIVESDSESTEALEHIVMFVCTMAGRFTRFNYDFTKTEFDYTNEVIKFYDPVMNSWTYLDMTDINQIVTFPDWKSKKYPDYFYMAGI